jgi:simple sugar transport system permease protein
MRAKNRAVTWLALLGVLFFAAAASALTIVAVKESPWQVLKILLDASFGSMDSVSMTLAYATPLLLTGAAVLIPYRAGLFNIGAEGQLYMGALAAISWGLFAAGLPRPLLWSGGVIAAALGGGLWGLLAGALKVKRGVHEVIATIMLNFIAMAFSNWVILYPLKNPETQGSETRWIAESLQIQHLWQNMSWSFPFILILTVAAVVAIRWTWWGYRVRACGENQSAARVAGVSVNGTLLSSMFIGGALAGLVGFHEVFCVSYRLIDGFSPQYGFTGIAIALMCRGSVPGFLASTIFFAALHKGTLELDMETENITRDLSSVIQALFLIAIAMGPALERSIASYFTKREARRG